MNILGCLWLSVSQPLLLHANTNLFSSEVFLFFVLSFPSYNFIVSLLIDSILFFNHILLMLMPGCGRGEGRQGGDNYYYHNTFRYNGDFLMFNVMSVIMDLTKYWRQIVSWRTQDENRSFRISKLAGQELTRHKRAK